MRDKRASSSPAAPVTARPPFDLAEFARESESRLRVAIPDSKRPTMPPNPEVLALAARVERATDVPELAFAREDLEWFELPPEARTLVRLVNGRDTVEAIARSLHRDVAVVVSSLDALAADGVLTWR